MGRHALLIIKLINAGLERILPCCNYNLIMIAVQVIVHAIFLALGGQSMLSI